MSFQNSSVEALTCNAVALCDPDRSQSNGKADTHSMAVCVIFCEEGEPLMMFLCCGVS